MRQRARTIPNVERDHTSQNSLKNCLHIPQGLAGGVMSVATAMARMSPFFAPYIISQTIRSRRWNRHSEYCTWITAVAIVTRSAHVPTGYAAFSTFAPSTIVPLVRSNEHPTRKCEYGPNHSSGNLVTAEYLLVWHCLTHSKLSPSLQCILRTIVGHLQQIVHGSARYHGGCDLWAVMTWRRRRK